MKETEKDELSQKTFTHLAKLVTKGLPKGFIQRDYTVSKNGKIAYSTIELPNGKRSFIIQLDLENQLPVLATFSGKYNDLEPFLVPGDTLLLFASDRPMNETDTLRDYNLWYVRVDGLEMGDPQPFDTLINTSENEFFPTMNRNGDLYFTAIYSDRDRKDDIYVSKSTDSGYVKPQLLTFCEKGFYEFNSFIMPDDQTILFTSYGRPGEIGGGDLFYSARDTTGKWQKPAMFGENLNTAGLDFCPFVKGDTLFFTSKRQDISWEKKEFNYLAEINSHSDSAAIGEQGIYIIPYSPLFKVEDPGNNK